MKRKERKKRERTNELKNATLSQIKLRLWDENVYAYRKAITVNEQQQQQ